MGKGGYININGGNLGGKPWLKAKPLVPPQLKIQKLGRLNLGRLNLEQAGRIDSGLGRFGTLKIDPVQKIVEQPLAEVVTEKPGRSGSGFGRTVRTGVLVLSLLGLSGPVISLIPGASESKVAQMLLGVNPLYAQTPDQREAYFQILREEEVPFTAKDISSYTVQDVLEGKVIIECGNYGGPCLDFISKAEIIIKNKDILGIDILEQMAKETGVDRSTLEAVFEQERANGIYGVVSQYVVRLLQQRNSIEENANIGPQTAQQLSSLGKPVYYQATVDSIKTSISQQAYREDVEVKIWKLARRIVLERNPAIGDHDYPYDYLSLIDDEKIRAELVNLKDEAGKLAAKKKIAITPFKSPWWDEGAAGAILLFILTLGIAGLVRASRNRRREKEWAETNERFGKAGKSIIDLESKVKTQEYRLRGLEERASGNELAIKKIGEAEAKIKDLNGKALPELNKKCNVDLMNARAAVDKAKGEARDNLRKEFEEKLNALEKDINKALKSIDEIGQLRFEIEDLIKMPVVPPKEKVAEKSVEKSEIVIKAEATIEAIQFDMDELGFDETTPSPYHSDIDLQVRKIENRVKTLKERLITKKVVSEDHPVIKSLVSLENQIFESRDWVILKSLLAGLSSDREAVVKAAHFIGRTLQELYRFNEESIKSVIKALLNFSFWSKIGLEAKTKEEALARIAKIAETGDPELRNKKFLGIIKGALEFKEEEPEVKVGFKPIELAERELLRVALKSAGKEIAQFRPELMKELAKYLKIEGWVIREFGMKGRRPELVVVGQEGFKSSEEAEAIFDPKFEVRRKIEIALLEDHYQIGILLKEPISFEEREEWVALVKEILGTFKKQKTEIESTTGFIKEEYLDKVVGEALKELKAFSAVYVGLDDYEGVLALYGSKFKDMILKDLAESFLGRKTEIRFGDGGIIVIVPEVKGRGASAAAESLRQAIEKEGIKFACNAAMALSLINDVFKGTQLEVSDTEQLTKVLEEKGLYLEADMPTKMLVLKALKAPVPEVVLSADDRKKIILGMLAEKKPGLLGAAWKDLIEAGLTALELEIDTRRKLKESLSDGTIYKSLWRLLKMSGLSEDEVRVVVDAAVLATTVPMHLDKQEVAITIKPVKHLTISSAVVSYPTSVKEKDARKIVSKLREAIGAREKNQTIIINGGGKMVNYTQQLTEAPKTGYSTPLAVVDLLTIFTLLGDEIINIKSGVMTITNKEEGKIGYIFLKDKEVINAAIGNPQGQAEIKGVGEALYIMANWSENKTGIFELSPAEELPAKELFKVPVKALFDLARIIDELKAGRISSSEIDAKVLARLQPPKEEGKTLDFADLSKELGVPPEIIIAAYTEITGKEIGDLGVVFGISPEVFEKVKEVALKKMAELRKRKEEEIIPIAAIEKEPAPELKVSKEEPVKEEPSFYKAKQLAAELSQKLGKKITIEEIVEACSQILGQAYPSSFDGFFGLTPAQLMELKKMVTAPKKKEVPVIPEEVPAKPKVEFPAKPKDEGSMAIESVMKEVKPGIEEKPLYVKEVAERLGIPFPIFQEACLHLSRIKDKDYKGEISGEMMLYKEDIAELSVRVSSLQEVNKIIKALSQELGIKEIGIINICKKDLNMKLEVLIAEPNRQRVRDKVKETLKRIEYLKATQEKDALKELAEIEKLLNEIEKKGKPITDDEIDKFLESI